MTNELMPIFFIGHGDPRNAIWDNPFTQSLGEMGKSVPVKPQAILVISAHWLTKESFVTMNPFPELIYDFSGFPPELYRVTYPAPGAPEFGKELMGLAPEVEEDLSRGLDHGAWTILKHMFPKADIPVFQLSINYNQAMIYHFNLARKLIALRSKGILVIGSGNIVHNLRFWFSKEDPKPYDWAVEFDEWVKAMIIKRDFQSLIDYQNQGTPAMLSVPTPDHFIPLLYSLGMSKEGENIRFTYEEVFTSASMRSFRIG
jgi:4,5-DOPA dioxygenase extradiol